tara:strand:- start:312 stop:881 length:570 start_codon:yes stop_codon:yes gene_type:complete
MRIIAGKYKGSYLYLTKDKTTRPLKDRARESIFNLLTHSNKIVFSFERASILDLYAGTGSFGLECLSRQAKSVFFIEKEKEAIKILKKNIEKLKIKKKTKIYFDEVFKLIEKQNIFISNFNLIFCDPPFKNKNIEKLVELIFYKNLLQKDGIIILHRNKNTEEKLPNYFKIIEERIYGISKITFGKFSS